MTTGFWNRLSVTVVQRLEFLVANERMRVQFPSVAPRTLTSLGELADPLGSDPRDYSWFDSRVRCFAGVCPLPDMELKG